MKLTVILIISNIVLIKVINGSVHELDIEASHPPFDQSIYEDVLDPEMCAKQLDYLIANDTILTLTCKYLKLSNDIRKYQDLDSEYSLAPYEVETL